MTLAPAARESVSRPVSVSVSVYVYVSVSVSVSVSEMDDRGPRRNSGTRLPATPPASP